MNLLPSPEQEEMAQAIAGILARHQAPDERLRAAASIGALGGAELGTDDEARVFVEVGRHLGPLGMLAAVLAGRVLRAGGADGLAAEVAKGTCTAGLALARPDEQIYVVHEGDAELVVLVDERRGVVWTKAPGRRVDGFDESVVVEIAGGVPETPIATAEGEQPYLDAVVLAAAVLVGIAERVAADSASYARDRVQFGRPIASFQAVMHRCVDMEVRARVASAQLLAAARLVSSRAHAAAFHASAAKLLAADAAIRNAGDNIQNHGAMGFTYEFHAHRYLKRAHLLDRLFGATEEHVERMVAVRPAVPA